VKGAPRPERPPVTLLWLNRRLIVVVVSVAAIVSTLVSIVLLLMVGGQLTARDVRTDSQIRDTQVQICDGTNLLRGFARLAIHGFKPTLPDPHNLGDYLLRIRDCQESYDQARIIVIPGAREQAFLAELALMHRVAVRDGGRRFVLIP
jgi:hypothetical protein